MGMKTSEHMTAASKGLVKRRLAGASPAQMDLFEGVLGIYLRGGEVSNSALYDGLAEQGSVARDDLEAQTEIGRRGDKCCVAKRRLRWIQQTLKALGVLERIPERRGSWRVTSAAKAELTPAPAHVSMLGFSTELGIALWSSCDVLARLDEPIVCAVTSPPYALARPRRYGNPPLSEYVDFVCKCMEPIAKNLAHGGSVALNISNDIFEAGSPARSLYRAHLVIALNSRLGWELLDELVWFNPSKAPGPVRWASLERMQLNVAYEPVYVFTNSARASLADNRRVLQPHTDRHLKLIRGGGEQRKAVSSDGAYRVRHGSYGNETAGRIPKNVLTFGHRCADQIQMRKAAAAVGLPAHGAPMPLSLAKFLVSYLSAPGDLVVDPFGGSMTTGKAAEELGRRWVCTDLMLEHVMAARFRFPNAA